jgi:hypothetical protein
MPSEFLQLRQFTQRSARGQTVDLAWSVAARASSVPGRRQSQVARAIASTSVVRSFNPRVTLGAGHGTVRTVGLAG